MYETLRIVRKLKPKYVIWENVPNLLSTKHRPNFERYCSEMAAMGYKNTAQVLNAADFGAPQARKRVYTVSKLEGDAFPFLKPTDTSKRFKDIMETDVDDEYFLTPSKMAKINQWKSQQKPFAKVMGSESVAPTITARGAGEDHSGMVTYSPNLTETTNLKQQVAQMAIDKGLVKEGDCINHSYAQKRLDEIENGTFKPINKEHPGVVATLTCRSEPCAMAVGKDDLRIRKITPLEAWRLMGFDDTDFNKVKAIGTSRSKLYKQAGNSIVVNVLEEIVKILFKL